MRRLSHFPSDFAAVSRALVALSYLMHPVPTAPAATGRPSSNTRKPSELDPEARLCIPVKVHAGDLAS